LSRSFPRALPSPRTVFKKLAESASFLSQFGEFNFIMSDGRALYARCGTRLHALMRQAPFAIAQLKDIDMNLNLAIRNQAENRMALIATDPLTCNEPWISFAPGEFRLFMAGQLVCSTQT
jgi:glutamine amidotransferase